MILAWASPFEHQYLQCLFSNKTTMGDFHPLEVVDIGSPEYKSISPELHTYAARAK